LNPFIKKGIPSKNASESCVKMASDLTWGNVACDGQKSYVCEVPGEWNLKRIVNDKKYYNELQFKLPQLVVHACLPMLNHVT